jgi:2-oxoacid:acceptor oxidoreductase delta subunit (pyruvate/2-ketoisovalerate family)
VHRGEEPLRVFCAGDVATNEGTVAHAIGDGRRAAGRALRALGLDAVVFERPDPARAVRPEDVRMAHFSSCAPAEVQLRPAVERRRGFVEVSRGLPDALEARRCFSCGDCTRCDTCIVYCPEGIIHRRDGGYEIDLDYCKGCGICVVECPRRAMEMVN